MRNGSLQNSLVSQVSDALDSSYERSIEWPWWLLGLILVAFAMATWLRLDRQDRSWRGYVSIAIRFCVFALLFGSMLGWYRRTIEVEPPEIAVVIDLSLSMQQQVDGAGPGERSTRYERLVAPVVQEVFQNQLGEKWNLCWFSIGAGLEATERDDLVPVVPGDADQEESRLGEGLEQLYRQMTGRPFTAVIFVSDGLVTAGRELDAMEAFARRRKIPIYPLVLDKDITPRDAELLPVQVPSRAIVGESLSFRVPVRAQRLAGESLNVTMVDLESGAELESLSWEPEKATDSTELIFIHEVSDAGTQNYEFRLSTEQRDLDASNDVQAVQIQAFELQHRILIVANEPHYEYRFLKHTLERSIREVADQSVAPFEVNVFLQDSVPEFSQSDENAINVFPATLQELAEYDVVFLFDPVTAEASATRGLNRNDLELLKDYVQARSGNLVWIAGPDFDAVSWLDTPLEELLPASPSDFVRARIPVGADDNMSLIPTAMGANMAPFQLEQVQSKRDFEWGTEFGTDDLIFARQWKPSVRRLLETDARFDDWGLPAAVVTMRLSGSGAVVFQGHADAYRLRFRRDDAVLNAYWSQWIQLLSKRKWLSQQAWREFMTDRLKIREDESIRVLATLADATRYEDELPQMRLISEEGVESLYQLQTSPDRPLTYELDLKGLAVGSYRASLVADAGEPSLETRFQVTRRRSEQDVAATDLEALQRLAKASGGELTRIEKVSRLLRVMPKGKPVVVGQRPNRPLWDQRRFVVWIGLIVVGLLVIEWGLRLRELDGPGFGSSEPKAM